MERKGCPRDPLSLSRPDLALGLPSRFLSLAAAPWSVTRWLSFNEALGLYARFLGCCMSARAGYKAGTSPSRYCTIEHCNPIPARLF